MVERYVKDSSGSSAVRWGFFIVFAALFSLDLWFVVSGRSQTLDENILGLIFGLREDALTTVFKAITFCGNWQAMLGLCILIILLPGRLKIGLPVSLVTGVGTVAQTLIKDLVARPRPDIATRLVEETSYSFPSGHANASMIFWTALLILVGRALVLQGNALAAGLLRVLFFIFAALIGLSRLYLGVHYPSDVFGGWMLAAMLLILFFSFYENVWPSKWRMSYYAPEWDTIPRGAEDRRHWRKPPKKRAPAEQIQFPKKTRPWNLPRPPEE